MTQSHLERLLERHEELELQIREEQHRPKPNEILIHELKRTKLHIKEQIEALRMKMAA